MARCTLMNVQPLMCKQCTVCHVNQQLKSFIIKLPCKYLKVMINRVVADFFQ